MKKIIFNCKNGFLRQHSHKALRECLSYEIFHGNEKLNISFGKRKALVGYAYNHCPFIRNTTIVKVFIPQC